jgi:LPS sulfotransferase NodH
MTSGFVIDSLPRTGSTTLANLLNCHSQIRCLIEPFHPRRYGGHFRQMALRAGSVDPALNLLWHRWQGIKHVWEASRGWPFPDNWEFNDAIVLRARCVLYLQRRNLLRRYISSLISRQLKFWIGTRQEFVARLESVQLCELDPVLVRQEIANDRAASESRLALLHRHGITMKHIFYEDFLGEDVTSPQQFAMINAIIEFLGYEPITEAVFATKCALLLDKSSYQWASPEIYRLIPGIHRLEREVGSDETGWIFATSDAGSSRQ